MLALAVLFIDLSTFSKASRDTVEDSKVVAKDQKAILNSLDEKSGRVEETEYCNVYCQKRKNDALDTFQGQIKAFPGYLKVTSLVFLAKTRITEWFKPRLGCVDSTLIIDHDYFTQDNIPEPFG